MYNAPALKDLLAVLIIAIAIYEVATGKVSTRNGGVIWRKTHPVAYCINTGMAIVIVLFLLFVVVSDLSRAEFAAGISNTFK
jgi:hypothetical protein